MKRQAEYDQIRDAIIKTQDPFGDRSHWLAQQEALGEFRVWGRVRYQGEVTQVATVDNVGHTLKYTLYRLSKYELSDRKEDLDG